jgi:hypothetical protein
MSLWHRSAALPFLAGVRNAVRVWAMADEWVTTTSHMRGSPIENPGNLREALKMGAYERAYASMVDRVWRVRPDGAPRMVRRNACCDPLPLGVDTDFTAHRGD